MSKLTDDGRTHWDGCYLGHHECALVKLYAAEAGGMDANRQLRIARESIADLERDLAECYADRTRLRDALELAREALAPAAAVDCSVEGCTSIVCADSRRSRGVIAAIEAELGGKS